jgi:amino acid transporter
MGLISGIKRAKSIIVGGARDPQDKRVFHNLSLIAFLAWVGLGSDGLSSSCYGPEEAFLALHGHTYLAIFVALGTAVTIFIISHSYSQIIELFPTGGGGYLVGSKLLSPKVGMISGCALLIDYVMTVTLSVASGADAIFSFLPPVFYPYRLYFAIFGVILLTILNMRGIKEAVIPLVPIFLTFVATHLFAILYTLVTHSMKFGEVYHATGIEINRSYNELGLFGMLIIILKAYSMGAGTFTGIEAVSNGLPILRDPKVKTAHKTMNYIAISLTVTVTGIILAYLLYKVSPEPGKTLNAVFFERMTQNWGAGFGTGFMLITLISEAVLLFIAAQTGFLDGPRVLSNMALDRWFPTRFAMLSDRLVTQNGILLMGGAALIMMIIAKGSVKFLIVLYSINVFVTFSLSQLGMVRHWWKGRKTEKGWLKKMIINGVGLTCTTFILISVVVIKFGEGGWITIFITGSLVLLALYIKRHYDRTFVLLKKLDVIVDSVEASIYNIEENNHEGDTKEPEFDPRGKTAAILVNGFNALGLHTLMSVLRIFSGTYKNFVFISVGSIDAGNFKGLSEVENLTTHIQEDTNRYVSYMKAHGFYAEAHTSIGIDVVDEIMKLVPDIENKFSNTVYFGGQLVFPEETIISKILHNYIVFTAQRKFYTQGLPFVILPIRV